MAIQPWISVSETEFPDDPEASEAVAAASFLLFKFSGRKYSGPQTFTEVYDVPFDPPLRGRPYSGMSSLVTAPGRPYLPHRREIRLRVRPVWSVNQVRVGNDQRVIDPSEYELFNGSSIRPSIGASWRANGPIEVTYTGGAYPPESGKRAARVLANELLKSRRGRNDCQLPERVTSVSREGISMTVLDGQEFLDHGRTGIYEVDLFLKAANPSGALNKTRVLSPDLPRVRRFSTVTASSELGQSDLGIVPGVQIDKTFTWIVGGDFVPLTGNWIPSAGIYTSEGGVLSFDFTPYVSLEPDGVPGEISLLVPATATSGITAGGVWNLSMINAANPATVVRITGGRVIVE